MTLGCGGYGGNITSDNISPRHLLNIKRLAYETEPAPVRQVASASAGGLPQAPAPPRMPGGIAAAPLARRIDAFLASRGYTPPAADASGPSNVERQPDGNSGDAKAEAAARGTSPTSAGPIMEKPSDFVCEDDVRQAVRQGRKIVIGERTIVTPAARDLGEQHRVFVQASWPR
jgi:hypothetical protein